MGEENSTESKEIDNKEIDNKEIENKEINESTEDSGIEREIKKADSTLQELCAGVFFFGAVCQLTLVWLIRDKAGFSLGLWLGVLLAIGGAVHMRWSIEQYLDRGMDAPGMALRDQLLRYAVDIIVLVILMVTKMAQPLACFLGLMGLKVAAYIVPITHKLIRR